MQQAKSLLEEINEFDPEFVRGLNQEENGKKRILRAMFFPDVKVMSNMTRVLDTTRNLEWLLSQHNISVRYNMMTRRREIRFTEESLPSEDYDNTALISIQNLCVLTEMPIQHLDQHLEAIAVKYAYHPVVDALKEVVWDGEKRIGKLAATLKTPNPDFTEKLLTTWMVAALAAAHSKEGFVQHGVLVLQGPQGIGKTSFIRQLDFTNTKAIKIGAFLDPNNKDSIIQLAQSWIVELGELDSVFTKSAIGRLKSFVTMEWDEVRNPYARKSTRLARRTAYAASVNEVNYLIDETGNRRWWTIPVTEIDLSHDLDMCQVWAEVLHLWNNGHPTYLEGDDEVQLSLLNEEFEKVDPIKEALLSFYDWENSARKEQTATEIYTAVFKSKPTKAEVTRIGAILMQLNDKKPRKSKAGNLHEIPLFKNSSYGI